MSAYRAVLFLHLVTVVMLVSAAIVSRVGVSQLRRARRVEQVAAWIRSLGSLKIIFPVGVVLLFLTGGWLVHLAFRWTEGWVIVSALSLLAVHVNGSTASASSFRAIGMAMGGLQDGPVPAAARAPLRAARMWYAVHANLGIVLGVIWVMETKPALLPSVGIVLAMTAVGLAVAWPTAGPSPDRALTRTPEAQADEA
jgi:hypothetical protein